MVLLKKLWLNGETIHPSILAVASEYEDRTNFPFDFISNENVLAEVKALDVSKTFQENDIPIKIIKTNDNFFAEAICCYFNKSSENSK